MNTLTPCPDDQIAQYTARRVAKPLQINGDLSKTAWQNATWTPRFVDMASGSPGFYNTRAALLWDDEALYIAFRVEEPFVEAQHTERDSIIFQENDVEVFIDGGDCYYELELNAIGTIYEVFFIWRDAFKRGGPFDLPEFDLFDDRTFSFGGDYDRTPASFWRGTHPRGGRWAFTGWDFPGLQVATQIQGTLNDDSDIDRSWTAEIALPWQGMTHLANGRSLPPQAGDVWRIFLGRFQKLMNAGKEIIPHPAWVLSPHGIYDTHQPACFPYIAFSDEMISEEASR
ncbi:MAG: carbohydrate-binding family 9-like protein [Aggregatilineales bacterium]